LRCAFWSLFTDPSAGCSSGHQVGPTRAEEEAVGAEQVARGWAGIDVGKAHHWVCLIDEAGSTLWSSKVVNDEAAILDAIAEVLARAQQVSWAVDITGTSSALLLALLTAHGQGATYVPGRTVNQMSTAYSGEAKTDARDAYVIAETVRLRGDLTPVDVPATLVAELRLLVTHRTDLVADRVRMINRLRDVLSGYFPSLEREFDYSTSRGAVVLLTGYQTPAAIRARGRARLSTWLRARKVRSAEQIATAAVRAANAQHTTVPGQDVAASIVAEIAAALLERAVTRRSPAVLGDWDLRRFQHLNPEGHLWDATLSHRLVDVGGVR
jgi:hypothetical protein